jgi:hypothetical protein
MLEVEKWAQNIQPFLAAYAQFMAYFSDEFHEAMEEAKEGALSVEKYPYPDLKVWLQYYRSNNPIFDHFSEVFLDNKYLVRKLKKELNGKAIILEFAGNEKESFLKKKVLVPEDVQQKNIVVRKDKAETIHKVSTGFVKNAINGENAALIEKLKSRISSNDELSFVYRVWMPCFYFHGKTPPQMLRKARLGDLQSLEDLIRIDSSVIYDNKISSALHNLRNKSKRKHNELMDCVFKKPEGNVSKKKIKCFLAGMIWIVSKGFNLPLTEPEVRGLFDAIARDKGYELQDPDLPESPHAFYMAMQREMKSFFAPT